MASRAHVLSALSAVVATPVRADEPLASYTTFRIGGPADYLVTVNSSSELSEVLAILAAHDIAHVVIGSGSNLLVSDAGYRGAVIRLGEGFGALAVRGTSLVVGGSARLSAAVRLAAEQGLSGLEFAAGIPGTVGGAIAMNAGSRDVWIGSVVSSVSVLGADGAVVTLAPADVEWGYRTTSIRDHAVVLETTLTLTLGDPEMIQRAMAESLARRRATQPLDRPNAGSVFRNPPGDSAGRLIEACGLKGARVGGAEISTVHANFIVAGPGATAADVAALMDRAAGEVSARYGIELTPEIRLIG